MEHSRACCFMHGPAITSDVHSRVHVCAFVDHDPRWKADNTGVSVRACDTFQGPNKRRKDRIDPHGQMKPLGTRTKNLFKFQARLRCAQSSTADLFTSCNHNNNQKTGGRCGMPTLTGLFRVSNCFLLGPLTFLFP